MEHAPGQRTRGFSFDSASVFVLAGTLGLAALLAIPSAAVPFLSSKVSLLAAGAIIALALFILARLVRQNIIVPPMTLVVALWLVPLAYLLSALFSSQGLGYGFYGTELEVDTAGFVVAAALIGTLAALVLRRRGEFVLAYRILTGAFILLVVAQLVFIAVAQASPSTVTATTNLLGAFGDFGMLMGLGVALSLLAFRFLAMGSRMRIVLWAATIAALFVTAVVNNTFVWVLVGLVALGLFIEAIMRRRPQGSYDSDLEGVEMIAPLPAETENASSGSIGAPLVVLAIALFFIIGGSTLGNALANGLSATTLDVRPSWQSTFDVGSHTYASAPVFGSGPGTFGEEWLKYRDRSINETAFWTIEFNSGIGYVPTSMVTTGVVGALAWILFFALFLIVGVRFLLVNAPADAFLRFVSLSSFVGAVYLFALMVFNVPGPVLIALAFFMAGVFASTLRHGTSGAEWGIAFVRSPRLGFVIVFALTLLLLGSVLAAYTVAVRYISNTSYLAATNALAAGNLDAGQAATAQSIMLAPSDRAYRLQSAIGIARMNAIANDAAIPQDQARESFQTTLQDSIASALTATQLNARDYRNWVQLGNVYASVISLNIEGAYDNAKIAYARARELNPSNPTLPYVVAQLEIAAKKPAEAETLLQEAISLKRNYTEAIFLLSQLEVQLGKAREALLAAEAAAYFAPQEPGVLFQVGLLRLGTGDVDGAIAVLRNVTALDPSYANAHFFLGVAFASKKDFPNALTEIRAVAALSPENQAAVADYLVKLEAGENPFPATLSLTPVQEPPAPPTATETPETVAP